MSENDEFKTMREWAVWALENYSISREAFGRETPEYREVLRWLFPVFENGRRRCELVPEEWDFRGIKDLSEARQASLYEYRREVLRLYEWEVDCMKFVGKYHPDVVILRMALTNKWPFAPDPWLLLSESAKYFPTPWLKCPIATRSLKYVPIPAAYSIDPDSTDLEWLPFKSRAHTVVIQWNKPDSEIKRDLSKLIDELRPSEFPRVKPLRGKRRERPFDELKWLAAWRLQSAGLTYEQAQHFLKGNVRGDDPHAVIPRYASSGAWQTHALDKARAA
jgi:hypothetical protein